jgi:ubiquinone/menaquinone biosynthesis C-methylase UbiE
MSFDPEAVRAFERAGWNRAAAGYETAFATASRQFVPALLDAAGVGPGLRVLDVCCGPGVVTAAAAERGAVVGGLDFSVEMLDLARARHPTIAFEQGDAEALPYPDAAFDAVVSNFGIHHVPRPILALREAHRVLRRGGRLAFTVWAAPAENIAWKLVQEAVSRCGDPSLSTAPVPGGGFGSAADCVAALEQAGFATIGTEALRRTWRHANGAALLAALRAGTARMAAMIGAQPEAALPAIIADIDDAAAGYRDAAGLAVPIAAIVAHGVRV